MQSKKINQLATELAPDLTDITIIGDPTTGISKKITLSQMASLFTGTVEEYANKAAFPLVGVADTIYIALDTNIIWRWNTGSGAYVELSPNIINSLVFGDGSGFDGTISLVGSTATLTITTALTTGSVAFIGAAGALLEDNTNFFWNNTTKRLGIGTNTPGTKLDVHGAGTIVQLNGTTTNNAFISFQNAGTNKWSVGNVQADHRFRIYSEVNSAELVSVLQTGEFGIGIANPLTKLHIFGGASALIANLDANTSVAKSISFRSGNSSRINLEVSGTESGSNAGANFFLRTYTDAGSLLATPLTITRSTGAITLATALSGTSATFSGQITSDDIILTAGTLFSAGNTGFSNRLSDTTLYLQMPATGFNITDNALNTKFILSSAGLITIYNTSTIRSGNELRFNRADNAIFTSINDAGSGAANGLILNNTNGEGFHFKNASTTIMRMNSSHNVLIGTTTDNGRKLNVNGSGLFSGTLSTAKIEMGSIGGGVNITTNSTFELISSGNFAFRSNMIVSVSIYWNNNSNAQRQYLLFLGATDTAWGTPSSAISVISSNDWSSGYVGAATFSIGGSSQLRTLNISVSNAVTYNVTAYASILVM